MTQDSEGDRSQKTVAELLAQHGGSNPSGRRRHRRAAEEGQDGESADGGKRGVSDTAPQAIIDRIQGQESEDGEASAEQGRARAGERAAESNGTRITNGRRAQPPQASRTTQAQPPAQQPPAQQPPAQQPPAQQPPAQQPAQPAQPPRQPQGGHEPEQQRRPIPRPPAPGGARQHPQQQEQQASEPAAPGSLAARLDGAQAQPAPPAQPEEQHQGGAGTQPPEPPPAGAPPARPPKGRGGFPRSPNGRRSPLRPARRAEPEPNTDQFPAVSHDAERTSAEQETGGATGVGPDVSTSAPPAGLARWRQRRRKSQAEDTDIGVVPPVPAEPADQAAPSRQTPAPQPVEDEAGPPTGAFTPSFDTGTQDAVDDYEDYDYYDGDWTDTEFDDADHDDVGYDGDLGDEDFEEFDYDETEYDEAEDDYDDYDDPDEQAAGSPARQWLVLAGQLALGVVGGAGVWLGFNWLWGQMPSAALIAALLATVALVWVVRKVRRADDTQTTVLALLVGLVVSVSPAALLLVSR